MKSMSSTLMTLILIMMMAVLLFAGCGSNEPADTGDENVTEQATEAANELTEEEIADLEARIADQYIEELKKASDERVSNGEEGAELLDCRIESVHVLSNEEKQDMVGDSDYGPNDILAVVNYSVKPKDIESWLPANGEVDGEWIVNKQACVCIPEGSDSIGGLGGTGF